MKILIGNFVLADSPDPIPLTNLRITGSGNVQPAQFFRAAATQFYDRGNQKTEVSFDTTQLWPNQLAAETYILMLRTMFPTQGLVTFVARRQGHANRLALPAKRRRANPAKLDVGRLHHEAHLQDFRRHHANHTDVTMLLRAPFHTSHSAFRI